MKDPPAKGRPKCTYRTSTFTTWLQTPLPSFLHTLPILITIEGQGSGRQGPPPLAPPEEPKDA